MFDKMYDCIDYSLKDFRYCFGKKRWLYVYVLMLIVIKNFVGFFKS